MARAKSISTELTLFPRSTCTHLDPRLSRPNTHHPERYELPLYFRPTLSNKAFATIGPTSHCACRDSHTPSHLHVHTRVHTCTWWLRGISRQWLEHTGGGEGRGKNDEGVLNGSQFLLRIVIFVLRWLHVVLHKGSRWERGRGTFTRGSSNCSIIETSYEFTCIITLFDTTVVEIPAFISIQVICYSKATLQDLICGEYALNRSNLLINNRHISNVV